ncbi:transcriptional regulator, HxlR family [Kibdelosporangium aridum]|uniref:Transcriptional regulator, HxlR family n=2 Tax=Kibdelosporangium aridum TaxID=2030 RepID=A0A1Y5YDL9_KIBAR|nr:transcriptional regulator, HxlR family [Kibdelosporangium aridum]
MAALATGERQFNELRAAINESGEWAGKQLTPRVLTDTLQRAQKDGLIDRHRETPSGRREDTGQFAAVVYRLTPMGRSLLQSLRPLADWAQRHHDKLPGVDAGA